MKNCTVYRLCLLSFLVSQLDPSFMIKKQEEHQELQGTEPDTRGIFMLNRENHQLVLKLVLKLVDILYLSLKILS